MASPSRHRHRLLLAAVLGAVLAGEITGIAVGRALPPIVVPVNSSPTPAPAVTATPGLDRQRVADARDARTERVRLGVDVAARGGASPSAHGGGRSLDVTPGAKTSARVTAAASPASASRAPSSTAASYHGVNHVWIPSLGISKGIQSFPCSRSRPPDAGVYRWGCAGANNVYLLSHAWSTFKPLHDAYVRGTLRKGMRVWYADGGGHVREFRVIWWKVTAPTTAASWAWAALPSPGMTLQTCVGANSAYRLMVRLDRVGWSEGAGLYTTRRSSSFRAITSRWTWLVPSPISVSFASRR